MIGLVAPVYRTILLVVELIRFVVLGYRDVFTTVYHTFVPPEERSLHGQTVLVTGAAHGLGHQLARQFAGSRCHVVCWDVDQAANETSAAKLRQEFPEVEVVTQTVDVSDQAAVHRAASSLLQRSNGLDILVNNAGICPAKQFLKHSVRELRAVMDTNVMSHMWTLRSFVPVMRRAGAGSVVCICSTCGMVGSPSVVPYCASKHALRGLMEALVEEERHFSSDRRTILHYLTVYPFIMDTRMVQHARVRFPWLMPVMSAEYVAAEIVRSVKRSDEVLFFPKWMYPGFLFSKLWPRRMQQRFNDLISVGAYDEGVASGGAQG